MSTKGDRSKWEREPYGAARVERWFLARLKCLLRAARLIGVRALRLGHAANVDPQKTWLSVEEGFLMPSCS